MNREYEPYESIESVAVYKRGSEAFWNEFPREITEDFIYSVQEVPHSRNLVLCIGSGLGEEAVMLRSYGIQPVCFDGSATMINASVAKLLPSVQGNFLSLPFHKAVFDGVWAYKSLNHSEDMHQLSTALSEVKRVIKKRGAFSICMLEGRSNDRKSAALDGTRTRENLYLTEDTFHEMLEENDFLIQTSANIRRGHTNYMIANTVNFS